MNKYPIPATVLEFHFITRQLQFICQTNNKNLRFPTSAGFQKMEAKQKLSDGSTITMYYQYNSYTNKAYDIKITTPQRHVNEPAKVIDSIKDVAR